MTYSCPKRIAGLANLLLDTEDRILLACFNFNPDMNK